MSIGTLARRLLGKNFHQAVKIYRAVFVDVGKIADRIAQEIPRNAHCLDVGGGDGLIVNAILDRRPDLTVTMIDIAAKVGGFIEPRHAARVTIHASTALANLPVSAIPFDAVIMTDVLHHIPAKARNDFFRDLRLQTERGGCHLIVIKDVEPGGLRSVLSVLSDKYITGDPTVSLVSQETLRAHLHEAFGSELAQFHAEFPDFPNYFAVAKLRGIPRAA